MSLSPEKQKYFSASYIRDNYISPSIKQLDWESFSPTWGEVRLMLMLIIVCGDMPSRKKKKRFAGQVCERVANALA